MKHTSLYLLLAGSTLLSSCGLFGHYERDTQGIAHVAEGIYRDPVNPDAAMQSSDTLSFGNTPWQEIQGCMFHKRMLGFGGIRISGGARTTQKGERRPCAGKEARRGGHPSLLPAPAMPERCYW